MFSLEPDDQLQWSAAGAERAPDCAADGAGDRASRRGPAQLDPQHFGFLFSPVTGPSAAVSASLHLLLPQNFSVTEPPFLRGPNCSPVDSGRLAALRAEHGLGSGHEPCTPQSCGSDASIIRLLEGASFDDPRLRPRSLPTQEGASADSPSDSEDSPSPSPVPIADESGSSDAVKASTVVRAVALSPGQRTRRPLQAIAGRQSPPPAAMKEEEDGGSPRKDGAGAGIGGGDAPKAFPEYPAVKPTREQLVALFAMPIKRAAAELRISETILKKIVRSYGINRWPWRKFECLAHCREMITKSLGKGEIDHATAAKHRETVAEAEVELKANPDSKRGFQQVRRVLNFLHHSRQRAKQAAKDAGESGEEEKEDPEIAAAAYPQAKRARTRARDVATPSSSPTGRKAPQAGSHKRGRSASRGRRGGPDSDEDCSSDDEPEARAGARAPVPPVWSPQTNAQANAQFYAFSFANPAPMDPGASPPPPAWLAGLGATLPPVPRHPSPPRPVSLLPTSPARAAPAPYRYPGHTLSPAAAALLVRR
eukprot:tig00000178_g12789.t1